MRIDIALVIFAVNHIKSGETKVMFQEEESRKYSLPKMSLPDNSSIQDTASLLLKKYTNVEPVIDGVGWINLICCPPVDNFVYSMERIITCPFGAMLPDVMTINGGTWLSLNNIFSRQIVSDYELDIIRQVSTRI